MDHVPKLGFILLICDALEVATVSCEGESRWPRVGVEVDTWYLRDVCVAHGAPPESRSGPM